MVDKKFLLLGILVIFLTIGCASAAENDATTLSSSAPSLGSSNDLALGSPLLSDEAPIEHYITEETYTTFFDDNGTYKASGEEGKRVNIYIGDIGNKDFRFNSPNMTITAMSESSTINNGTVVLLQGAEGTTVYDLSIVKNGFNAIAIESYASNVNISYNDIQLSGEAEYNFAAILIHDSDNVIIDSNTISINATGQYAYGIDLYANFVEGAKISKASIRNNVINGVGEFYLAGISAMNGVVDSEIIDNIINLKVINLTYGIATAKNYADSSKSGNILINNNEITLEGDMVYGIESSEQVNLNITDNNLNITGNGAVGIGVYGLDNGNIEDNNIDIVGGTLTNSYYDMIPNGDCGIYIVGSSNGNKVRGNTIMGINVNGISSSSSETNIDYNIIDLTSDDNIQLNDYGSSIVMGIESTVDNVAIEENEVTVTGDATYNYGIDVYSYPVDISNIIISDNEVKVVSDSDYGAAIYTSLLENSEIKNNDLIVMSEGMTYGIVADIIHNSTIIDNKIEAEGSNTRAIELTSSDNAYISGNIINATGDSIYGIAASELDESTIDNNFIETNAGDLDDAYDGYDLIPAGQAAIYVDGSDNDADDNELVGLSNYVLSSNIDADNLEVDAGSGENFTMLLVDSLGAPIIGQHVSINLTRVSSGASKVYDLVTDFNGLASIPIFLAKGDYTAKLIYNNNTMGDTTYLSKESETFNITVTDGKIGTLFTVSPMTKTYGDGTKFTGTLTTTNGSPVIGQHVLITLARFSGQSKTYEATTDYNGVASIDINLAPSSYLGIMAFEGMDPYLPSESSMVSITVLNP